MIFKRLIYDYLSVITQCHDGAEDVKDEGQESNGTNAVSLIAIHSLLIVHY